MTNNKKPRDRWNGAGPKPFDSHNHTEADPLVGWFSLVKSSRINRQQKRGWKRGRK